MIDFVTLLRCLKTAYPNAKCALDYSTDFQLLVAVVLSAQCTDKRVNLVTPNLFKIAPTAKIMAVLSQKKLEELIFSCGFYRAKAKNLIDLSVQLVDKYGGTVPSDFDSLVGLKGVGRKTALVIMAELFNFDVAAVDTHVFRTARRIGLSKSKTEIGVEKDLKKLIENYKNGDNLVKNALKTLAQKNKDGFVANTNLAQLLIFLGRNHCKAKNPLCFECCLKNMCLFFNKSVKFNN